MPSSSSARSPRARSRSVPPILSLPSAWKLAGPRGTGCARTHVRMLHLVDRFLVLGLPFGQAPCFSILACRKYWLIAVARCRVPVEVRMTRASLSSVGSLRHEEQTLTPRAATDAEREWCAFVSASLSCRGRGQEFPIGQRARRRARAHPRRQLSQPRAISGSATSRPEAGLASRREAWRSPRSCRSRHRRRCHGQLGNEPQPLRQPRRISWS